MLRPPGHHSTELGDIEVFVHEGELHLFHLCLPNHDRIAHWVSVDGIEWEARPDALRTGDPGSFDDDQLWTMSVTRHGGKFVMLYTALSSVDHGRVQRVARATSDDLERWTKDPQPVAMAAGDRYETTPGRSAPWVTFRDPKPLALDDGYAVVVSAQVPSGPPHRRGAVALMRSDDLESFTLESPIYAPCREFELECPQLIPTREGMVMIASIQDDQTVRWFRSDALEGPYRTPAHNQLLPSPYYAARVFSDERGLGIAATYRYDDRRGRRHHVLPTPLRLDVSDPGRIQLRLWEPASSRFSPDSEPLHFDTPCFGNGTTSTEADGLVVLAGEELWTGPEHHGDAVVRGSVQCDGVRFGLAFDISPDGAAWFVELEPAHRQARLVRRGPRTDSDGMPWFEHLVAQTSAWLTADAPTHDLRLQLLGSEVRLCIDGAMVLAAVIDRTGGAAGTFGVWVDSGRMKADLRIHRPLGSAVPR